MEASILQTLSFDISIPIPYRFLRRYAKVCMTRRGYSTADCSSLFLYDSTCVHISRECLLWLCLQCVSASMDTLTLARYYCEMSLMEMDLVPERGSLVASACLLMALVTKDLGGWVGYLHAVPYLACIRLMYQSKILP